MSLVAYESSDESEGENENPVVVTQETYNNAFPAKNIESPALKTDDLLSSTKKTKYEPENNVSESDTKHVLKNEDVANDTDTPSLFLSLPPPKIVKVMTDIDLQSNAMEDSVQKKSKRTVKILAPVLSDFDDEEDDFKNGPAKKKLKPSSKGSGLLSILPEPVHATVKEANRPLVPNSVTRKPSAPPAGIKTPQTVKKTSQKTPKIVSKADSGGESGDEDTHIDFFSLKDDSPNSHVVNTQFFIPAQPLETETTEQNIANLPEETVKEEPLSFGPNFKPSPWAKASRNYQEMPGIVQDIPLPDDPSEEDSSEAKELELDEEALQQLCGRRAKRENQEMQLIDISGETHLPNPKEWLLKQFTEERKMRSHSHKKNHGPTSQQRRKHQITYLAYQAKENELELKNQWAQNRFSRKQTQSKYGF